MQRVTRRKIGSAAALRAILGRDDGRLPVPCGSSTDGRSDRLEEVLLLLLRDFQTALLPQLAARLRVAGGGGGLVRCDDGEESHEGRDGQQEEE